MNRDQSLDFRVQGLETVKREGKSTIFHGFNQKCKVCIHWLLDGYKPRQFVSVIEKMDINYDKSVLKKAFKDELPSKGIKMIACKKDDIYYYILFYPYKR